MDDRVNPAGSNHLCDHRIADVGAYEIGGTKIVTRWNDVEPDYLDVLVTGERASEPGTQVT
jgi:hypothetical protein